MHTHLIRTHTRNERGSGMIAVIVLVVICAGLTASVLIPSMARHREAEAQLQRERALYLAEAGVDWGIATLRQSAGVLPGTTTDTQSPQGQGSFTLTYVAGNANGTDDDGDGFVDESDEDAWVTLRSVGASGSESRAVAVLLRAAVVTPEFLTSVLINVDAPVFDSDSNALRVDGREHDIAGTVDSTLPRKHAIGSPAPIADLESQIRRPELFVGLGGTPSVGQLPAMDLHALVEQTKSAATRVVEPGTHSGVAWGTPTLAGSEIVYCQGDLHLTGNGRGAGYLVIDGDLILSGGFLWQGVIVVRGAVRMTGGGAGKRVVGAMVVGEEIETVGGDTNSTATVALSGTVDLLFSTEAVVVANRRISIMSIMSWNEIPVP